MGVPDNLVTNYAKVAYTNYFKVDNIIGVRTGGISITAPTALQGLLVVRSSVPLSWNDSCYYQGIFSTDGGTTWNELGVMQPNLTTPGQPVLDTVMLQAYVTPSSLNLVMTNYYDSVHSTSAAYTAQYKIVLFAKNTQGTINVESANEKTIFDSRVNYQKIYLASSIAFSPTVGIVNTYTIPHSLGRVPRVRAFYIPSVPLTDQSGTTCIAGGIYTFDWIGNINAQADITNMYIYDDETASIGVPSFPTGTIDYRIYIDS